MQLNFFDVLSNLAGLFLLIAVGWAAVRFNLISANSSGALSKLLLNVTLPCTIFVSLLRPYDPDFITDVLVTIGLGFVLFPLNALLSAGVLTKLCRVPDGRKGVWAFCATFCNNGFMGFPIALALFGEEGLALAAIYGLPFNLLVYTLGVWLVCQDSVSRGGEKIQLRKVLLTGINAAALLGLVFYFCRLSVPGFLLTPLTHLSNVTTPLSMFVTGMSLAGGKLGELFRDRDILTASGTRLLVIPLLNFAAMLGWNALFPFPNPLILSVGVVIMAMPSPGVTAILAQTYGADREYAAGVVFVSSLLCILSIPAISMLL